MKPIIFSGDMVRALLGGTKTQTRRVMKPQPDQEPFPPPSLARRGPDGVLINCPYGQPGGLLWVRETWGVFDRDGDEYAVAWRATHPGPNDGVEWLKGPASWLGIGPEPDERWRSPIHMPRWASRLTLRLTDVRVQRVQDISKEDARAEGIPPAAPGDWEPGATLTAFEELWNSINAKRDHGWHDNPWVWALTFEVMQANVEDVWRGER